MSTLSHAMRRTQIAIVRFLRRDARTHAKAEARAKDDVVGPTFEYQIIRRHRDSREAPGGEDADR